MLKAWESDILNQNLSWGRSTSLYGECPGAAKEKPMTDDKRKASSNEVV